MHVKFESISKMFGERSILQLASFDFGSSGSAALMGPSGAGKSTVLALLAGLEQPDSGEVIKEAGGQGTHIAWIVQSTPLLTRRTVWDNVALGATCRGLTVREDDARIEDVLNRLRIGSLADHPVRQLSGGERQRVAVARGIMSSADVLLADEPTASLDAASRAAVCDALEEVTKDSRKLVIIATHDQYVAERCDRILHLESGIIQTESR